MFKLNENYKVDRNILKCDCVRYSPSEMSTINTVNSQIHINISREDYVISLLNSYRDLNFDVFYATTSKRYGENNDKRLFNSRPIASFSFYK